MSLPPLAGLEDLSARLGLTLESGSPDEARAAAALADASALIRSVAGQTWVDGEDSGAALADDLPDIVVTITLAVAGRAYRNPAGTTQAAVGDVSVSFGTQPGGGSIFLTREEERQIRRAGGSSSVGSVSMDTEILAPGSDDPLWAPTQGEDIPLGPAPWP